MKLLLNIIIFLFIAASVTIHAVTDESVSKEELLKKLVRIEKNDTTRLNILSRLSEISISDEDKMHYLNELLNEAKFQKNNKYQCNGYMGLMVLAYNKYDYEEVNSLMTLMEPITLKEKDYNTYFKGKRCVIDMLMVSGEYELEEKEALKMLKKAHQLNNPTGIVLASQCLSNLYVFLGRQKDAARILEECYATSLKGDVHTSFEVGNSLMSVYSGSNNHKNWLKWIKIQERNLNNYVKENPQKASDVDLWYLMTYIYYLDYYTTTDNLIQAEKYLQLSEKFHKKANFETVNNSYFRARYIYFYSKGQYEKSLEEADNLLNLFHNISDQPYGNMLFLKANALAKLDRDDEALDLYKKAFAIKDSLRKENFNIQTNQLKKDYKTDTLLLEGEKINRKRQLSVFLVLLIIIIILVCFIIHSYRVNIRLKKSEKEMQAMSDDMELANIAKERFLSNMSSSISIPLNEVVAGSIQLSTDDDMDKAERKALSEQINKKSAMLMKLINNILDLSRLEAGMMKYNTSDTEIVSLIRYTIEVIKTNSGTAIEYSLPEEQVIKNIDSKRLQEIITNLLIPIDEKPLRFNMKSVTENGTTKVFIYIYNTLLATGEKTQEIIVANEINRMLVEHFKGRYEIHSDEQVPYIEFTL